MNDSSRLPKTRLYALKLVADPAACGLAGRLEHIPSGRLFDFADGASLLSILAHEQAGGYLIDAPGSSPEGPNASR